MKRLALKSLLGMALVLGAARAATASTVFNFAGQPNTGGNSAMGDTLTTTVNGVTITETAWYVSNTSAGTTFQKAALDGYNGLGLTICSPTQGQGCSSPYHQIDNSNGVEFVQFQFSMPVTLVSAQLYVYAPIGNNGSDADITYYSTTTSLTTGTTLGSLGAGTNVNQSCTGSGGTACTGSTITDALTGSNVSYLLIGASVLNSDGITDAFKLSTLTVTTPEPANFGIVLLSIGGFALLARRMRKRA